MFKSNFLSQFKQLKIIKRTFSNFFSSKSKVVYTFTILISFFFIMQSCKKDNENVEIITDPIEAAKSALKATSKYQNINQNTENYRLNLDRTIHWDKSLSKKLGDSIMVYVPVTLSQDLTIKEGGKVGISINTITWLVVSNVKGAYDFHLVTKVPDKDMVNNGKFKGLMLVDDWFGEKPSYYVEQGNTSGKKPMVSKNGTITMDVTCKAISYLICVGSYCTQHVDQYCSNNNNSDRELSVDPDWATNGGGGGGIPPTPPPSLTPDPCESARALQNNVNFKNEMNNLMGMTNLNYEVGYLKIAGRVSEYRAGVPGTLEWSTPQLTDLENNSVEYMSHTHYRDPKALSVFSGGDIAVFAQFIYLGKAADPNTFTLSVTTASNTTYTLSLEDRTKLNQFYENYLTSDDSYRTLELKLFALISSDYSAEKNESGFLNAMRILDTGISILKSDPNLNSWTKLGLDANRIAIATPCK